jgi:uncharacterized protein YlxP (DUF503 family)
VRSKTGRQAHQAGANIYRTGVAALYLNVWISLPKSHSLIILMDPEYQIYIALISFELTISGSESLKAKRSIVNRVRDRIRSRFNASIAEVGYLDKWQRAAMAVTLVSNQKSKLQKDIDAIESVLREITDMSISNFSVEWL